ncbi:MAG: 23S rRNA (adenine(1618)-N(6))-methyltransferase RlmF [Bacteroidota bacterium]
MPNSSFHPRNRHHGRYDFDQLRSFLPELAQFLKQNKAGETSIDFADPMAVKALNKALLLDYYQLAYWDIPPGFLCPAIPGRADYVHHIADLLAEDGVLSATQISGLDIGIGANAIYAIIAVMEYGWEMVGSDVSPQAIEAAQRIANQNVSLNGKLDCRLQARSEHFFRTIIREGERYSLSLCNPPFHASSEAASLANQRKRKGLGQANSAALNFGGQAHELWFPGGEERFVRMMAQESKHYADQCLWFTSLLSRKEHVRPLKKTLKKIGAADVRLTNMAHGQKKSRIVAWTFQTAEDRSKWLSP